MSASDSSTVSPVPEHLRTVTPRLVVSDGAAAIAFYAQAFGAEQIGEPLSRAGRRADPRRDPDRRLGSDDDRRCGRWPG